jgi:hypothetical protein
LDRTDLLLEVLADLVVHHTLHLEVGRLVLVDLNTIVFQLQRDGWREDVVERVGRTRLLRKIRTVRVCTQNERS